MVAFDDYLMVPNIHRENEDAVFVTEMLLKCEELENAINAVFNLCVDFHVFPSVKFILFYLLYLTETFELKLCRFLHFSKGVSVFTINRSILVNLYLAERS